MEPRDKIFQQFKEAADSAADKASFPAMDKVWARVEEKLDADRPKRIIPFRRIAVAAAILLLICSGTVYFLLEKNTGLPAGPEYAGVQGRSATSDGSNNGRPDVAPAEVPPGKTTIAVIQPGGFVPGHEPGMSPENTTALAASNGDAKDSLHLGAQGYNTASYSTQPASQEDDRRRYAGSVAAATPDEISSRPVTDIVSALEAMSPGLPVTSGAGQPGSDPQIQIRGRNTFGNYTEPSVIVSEKSGNEYYKVYSSPDPQIFGTSMRTITGRISDADGNGIPGVSVGVKGAVAHTVTDANGDYTLRLPLKNDTLLIAGMGADTNNVVVGSNDDVSIVMASFPRELKKNRRSIVEQPVYNGSANAIASKAIGSRSAPGGKPAGTPVAPSRRSVPDKASRAPVSTGSTGHAATDALIVVDGKIYEGTLRSIDPNEIRTVTVLKEDAGTAIYGSRGRNGVIVVTTTNTDSAAAQQETSIRETWKERNFFGRTAWKIKKAFRKK